MQVLLLLHECLRGRWRHFYFAFLDYQLELAAYLQQHPRTPTPKHEKVRRLCFHIVSASPQRIVFPLPRRHIRCFKGEAAIRSRLPGWGSSSAGVSNQRDDNRSTASSSSLEPTTHTLLHPYLILPLFPSPRSIYVLSSRLLEIHTHIRIATTDLHRSHCSDKDAAD